MNFRILTTLIGMHILCGSCFAELITVGTPMAIARQALVDSKFKQIKLAMVAANELERLEFWVVDKGVLIVSYNNISNRVIGLSFYVMTNGPKAYRTTLSFNVRSFDTITRLLTIEAAAPKG